MSSRWLSSKIINGKRPEDGNSPSSEIAGGVDMVFVLCHKNQHFSSFYGLHYLCTIAHCGGSGALLKASCDHIHCMTFYTKNNWQ